MFQSALKFDLSAGERLLEHLSVEVFDAGADITAGVQAPTLLRDLPDGCDPAQPDHILVAAPRKIAR